ncbi:MAG TPA: CopD family protein [Chitinophagaceae bacterium]|nr:CopD family protein [Chitinophagaceae bacterium]
MSPWYYLTVWLHVLGATFWIGGMLFLPLVLLPSIKNNYERTQLLITTGLKFRFYGYIVLAVMFVTGLLNMSFKGVDFSWRFFNETRYGRLVVIKFILFVSLILISLTHDAIAGKRFSAQMQTEQSKKLKLITRWTGRILLLISLIMAYLGVWLSRGG